MTTSSGRNRTLTAFGLAAGLTTALLTTLAVVNAASNEQEASQSSEPRRQEVSVLRLQEMDLLSTQTLPGRVVAFKESEVRPQVSGVVLRRLFTEGRWVNQGDPLYQLDDRRYQAELAQAKADVTNAGVALKLAQERATRYQNLFEIKAISRQESDEAQAEFERAEAALAVAQSAVGLAELNVRYAQVLSPISGYVGRSLVSEGALVTANQADALTTITQVDPVYVDLQLSSVDPGRAEVTRALHQGVTVPVTVQPEQSGRLDAAPVVMQGALVLSELRINPATSSSALRALVPNPEGHLLPGMFVRAAIETEGGTGLLVPQRATARSATGQLTAWVVSESDTAEQRVLTVSKAQGDQWVVSGGVEAGERLIMAGYQKVSPGQAVTPLSWQERRDYLGQNTEQSTQEHDKETTHENTLSELDQ